MLSFNDLELFVRTAALGSISRAARDLNISPATASASLKRLEAKLEVRLFVRSTRHLRLTSEGDLFLHHARQALDNINAGMALLGEGRQQVRGALRISVPSDFGRQWMMPWLNQFQANHPHVDVSLLLTDRVSDFYLDAVDLAVRYGELRDSNLVAIPLCETQRVVCAAPAYLQRAGQPHNLDELIQHNCLTFYLEQGIHDRWRFAHNQREHVIQVKGDRRSDDGSIVRFWAVDGMGLAYRAWVDVADDIQAGRLVRVLPDYRGETVPIYLVYPQRQFMPPPLRLLINFLREKSNELPQLPTDL